MSVYRVKCCQNFRSKNCIIYGWILFILTSSNHNFNTIFLLEAMHMSAC